MEFDLAEEAAGTAKTEANDGGPAFPVGIPATPDNSCWLNEGMTLRDYFAAKALQGLMIGESKKGIRSKEEYLLRQQAVAEVAYEQADAMLKARHRD